MVDTPEEAGDFDCITTSYTGYVFPHFSANSGDGWLWIGGISSGTEDPLEAMKEVMDKLKCRYAYITPHITLNQAEITLVVYFKFQASLTSTNMI